MAQDRILPTNDLMFKKAFASEGNEDITIGLIQDFFGFTPKELILRTPYSIDAYMELLGRNEIWALRQTVKDIRASMVASDFIGELQMKKLRHYDERFFYYLCDDYCGNYNNAETASRTGAAGGAAGGAAPRANRYASLKPVYQLVILGESHYADAHPLRIFEPFDPARGLRPSSQLYRQAFFELGKGGDGLETANQRYWRDFFVGGAVADGAPEYIRRAAGLLALSNLSGKEREAMNLMERAVADYEAELECADYEGYQRGVGVGYQRGEQSGAEARSLEIAKKLIAMNLAFKEIREATGLSLEKIKALQARMNS